MDKALSPYVQGGGAKKYEAELKKIYGFEDGGAVGGFQVTLPPPAPPPSPRPPPWGGPRGASGALARARLGRRARAPGIPGLVGDPWPCRGSLALRAILGDCGCAGAAEAA